MSGILLLVAMILEAGAITCLAAAFAIRKNHDELEDRLHVVAVIFAIAGPAVSIFAL